jgi:hypothetical protein
MNQKQLKMLRLISIGVILFCGVLVFAVDQLEDSWIMVSLILVAFAAFLTSVELLRRSGRS